MIEEVSRLLKLLLKKIKKGVLMFVKNIIKSRLQKVLRNLPEIVKLATSANKKTFAILSDASVDIVEIATPILYDHADEISDIAARVVTLFERISQDDRWPDVKTSWEKSTKRLLEFGNSNEVAEFANLVSEVQK